MKSETKIKQEYELLANIKNCIGVVSNLSESLKPFIKADKNLAQSVTNIKRNNLRFERLFESVESEVYNLFESEDSNVRTQPVPSVINYNGNPYAFLRYVKTYFDKNSNVLQSLNESLSIPEIFGNMDMNTMQTIEQQNPNYISDFRNQVNNLIRSLGKIDETKTAPKVALKTKISLNLPLNCMGLNLNDYKQKLANHLEKPLVVIYNPGMKYMLGIGEGFRYEDILLYDIKTDKLSKFAEYQASNNQPFAIGYQEHTTTVLTLENYRSVLSRITGINMFIELWKNVNALNLQYRDNLYCDAKYEEYVQSIQAVKR